MATATPGTVQTAVPSWLKTVSTGVNSNNLNYWQPSTYNSNYNLNQGLIEYNPTASNKVGYSTNNANTAGTGVTAAGTPNYAAGDSFISDKSLVQNQITGLLDPNSEMNRQVQANVKANMNARGIAGSSIDDTAGQSAIIANATPIAQADASTYAQADLNKQDAVYGSQRATQDFYNEGALNQQETKLQGALNSQEAANQWQQSKLDSALQGDLNKQEANIAGAQTTQQEQYDTQTLKNQGIIEGAQAAQQGRIQAQLNTQQGNLDRNSQIIQGYIDGAAQTASDRNDAIMEAFSAEQQKQLANLQGTIETNIAKLGFDRQDTQLLAGMINSQTQTMMNQVGSLLNNTDIEMNSNTTKWISDFMESSWKSGADVFGINIDLR